MLYSFIDVPGLELDQEYVHETLVEFVKDQMSKARLKKAVFGLSGGLDSAVLAFLLVDALGSDNVLAAILPHNTTGPEVLKDAETVRDLLGFQALPLILQKSLITAIVHFLPLQARNRIRSGWAT